MGVFLLHRLGIIGELHFLALSTGQVVDGTEQGVHIDLLDGGLLRSLGLDGLCGFLNGRSFLRNSDFVHIDPVHIGSGIHFRLESLHTRKVSRSVVDGFQIGTDGIAQVVNHPLGEVHELAGTGFNMICGHLRTDEEHLRVEPCIELAQFLQHPLFQFLVFLGRDDGVLRAVGRGGRLGRGFGLFGFLGLRLGIDEAVIEFSGTAHHFVLGFLADAVLPKVGKYDVDFLRHIFTEEVLISLQGAHNPCIVPVAGKVVEGLLDVRECIISGFLLLCVLLGEFHLHKVVDEALRLVEGLAVNRRFPSWIVKEPAHVFDCLLKRVLTAVVGDVV